MVTAKQELIALGVGVVVLAYYGKQLGAWIKKTLPSVGKAFNPTSGDNLVARGADAVVGVFNPGASVGTAVADVFPSAAELKVNEMLRTPAGTSKTVPTSKRLVTPAEISIDPYGNPRPVAAISRNPYDAPGRATLSDYTGEEQYSIYF